MLAIARTYGVSPDRAVKLATFELLLKQRGFATWGDESQYKCITSWNRFGT